MKKILILSLSILLSSGLIGQKEWTFMVYLNGSDLEQPEKGNSGTNDINEMLNARSTSNVNMVVTTGGTKKAGWETIQRFTVENGQRVDVNFNARNDDMADTQNLTEFIDWATSNYPAEKFVLDLWNHGMDIRGYGHDENSDKEIKIPDLKQAIANSNFIKSGGKFEIIGFDACLMAAIEVQSTLKDYAKYYVGSEETEPGHGWNYTPIIDHMESGMATDGENLGIKICDAYKQHTLDQGTDGQAVTLSVVDLSKIDGLVGSIEDLTNKMKDDIDNRFNDIQSARSKAEEYSASQQDPGQSEDMVDIGDFMKQIKKTIPDFAQSADAVLSHLNDAVKYSVNDRARPRATGIAMFWPYNKFNDNNALVSSFMTDYNPIDFSSVVKTFMADDYVQLNNSDSQAPEGDYYEYNDDSGLISEIPRVKELGKSVLNRTSAIRINNTKDLDMVQVVLVDKSSLENEDEIVLLGSSLSDIEEEFEDGALGFVYMWDELWLGINGFPAFVSDIEEFEIEENGEVMDYITRVKIPVIINPDANDQGQDAILNYVRSGDEADWKLEFIIPETYGNNVMLTAKERIELNSGDVVKLLYQGKNLTTKEEFYVVDDEAVIEIENGNADLELGYDLLPFGEYGLGFKLHDYSQNDTIIYDPSNFVISSTIESFKDANIKVYPNPANNKLEIEIDNSEIDGDYQLELIDIKGALVKKIRSSKNITLNVANIVPGYYTIKITDDKSAYSTKIIIQR